MTGGWVFVCGASGSGKDSVMACAQKLLGHRQDIVFARRMVTRPVHPGSDHDAVTDAAFAELLRSKQLAWHWQAHGFSYGIARHYGEAVAAGCVVVVNGSRAHAASLPASCARQVVQITVDPARLAARLVQRGRDSADAVAGRLARNRQFEDMQADKVIVNDGALEHAGRALADYLCASSSAGIAAGELHLTRSSTRA